MSTQEIRGSHSTVVYPVAGDAQEQEFMNATLQSTEDPGRAIEFSVATTVHVDPRLLDRPSGADAIGRVAHALHDLFEWLGHEAQRCDGPLAGLSFRAEVGPANDGDGYADVPPAPPRPRAFTVTVPADMRATIRSVELLGERPRVQVTEANPGPA